jgi:hypothetical protein
MLDKFEERLYFFQKWLKGGGKDEEREKGKEKGQIFKTCFNQTQEIEGYYWSNITTIRLYKIFYLKQIILFVLYMTT